VGKASCSSRGLRDRTSLPSPPGFPNSPLLGAEPRRCEKDVYRLLKGKRKKGEVGGQRGPGLQVAGTGASEGREGMEGACFSQGVRHLAEEEGSGLCHRPQPGLTVLRRGFQYPTVACQMTVS
jgi:hypothetical protein